MIFLGLIAAAGLAASYYFNLFPLVWMILAGFFVYYERVGGRVLNRRFLMVLSVFILLHNSWMLSLSPWEGMAIILAGYLISTLYFLAWFVLAFKVMSWFSQERFATIWVAAIFVFVERAMTWGPWGYPFFSLYLTQAYSSILSFCDIPWMGSSLLSFVMLVTCGVAARLILRVGSRNRRLYEGFAIFFLFMGLLIVTDKLHGKETRSDLRQIRIALIQPNIPEREKLNSIFYEKHLDYYIRLLRYVKAQEPSTQVFVFPESIVSALWETRIADRLNREALLTPSDLLIYGLPVSRGGQIYNGVLFFGQGENRKNYLKRQLVPFGEYAPFKFWENHSIYSFSRGPVNRPVEIRSVKYGVAVCFESAFPAVFEKFRLSDILVVLTNDAWFNDAFKELHLRTAIFRAAELRKFLLFVNNSGYSAIIDPRGKVLQRLPAGKAGYVSYTIRF